MGIFFDEPKPRVSKTEWLTVRAVLSARGFTSSELTMIESLFRGDMDESSDSQKGIDAKEVAAGILWLKNNKSKHSISENQIAIVEEQLKKHL